MMENLINRYAPKIHGTLSYLDRVVWTGILPGIGYAEGMSRLLGIEGIRIFDYTKWAEPLRDEIRAHAERLAEENGLDIEFLRKKTFRKEDRIQQILQQRGSHPGLVHIFSAMDDPSSSIRALNKISRPVKEKTRSYRGFNLFDGDDLDLFRAIVQGKLNISGFHNRNIRRSLSGKSAHQVSRLLKRLRKHGLIKKIASTYQYYLTTLGRKVTAMALTLREMYIIPSRRATTVG